MSLFCEQTAFWINVFGFQDMNISVRGALSLNYIPVKRSLYHLCKLLIFLILCVSPKDILENDSVKKSPCYTSNLSVPLDSDSGNNRPPFTLQTLIFYIFHKPRTLKKKKTFRDHPFILNVCFWQIF